MRETVRARALNALDGMRGIVRREMLTTGAYVDDEVSNPRLVGALCGGRKHCAVGSLWAGAGIKPRMTRGELLLPGVAQDKRYGFLSRRPALRVAYESLNEAAAEFAVRNGLWLRPYPYRAPIEALFEGHYGDDLDKRDMLSIIAAAKRKVRAAR